MPLIKIISKCTLFKFKIKVNIVFCKLSYKIKGLILSLNLNYLCSILKTVFHGYLLTLVCHATNKTIKFKG